MWSQRNLKTYLMKKAHFQLNAVRKLLGLSFKFVDATLADGTAVKVEPEVEEGASVVVVTADGEEVPAPDGEHALADGRVIVTTDGVIIQVIEAPASAELEDKDKEEFASEEIIALITELGERIAALESKVAAASEPIDPEVKADEFAALKAAVTKLSGELSSANEVVVKLANQSKEKPTTAKFKKATPPSGDEINEVYANALFPNRKK